MTTQPEQRSEPLAVIALRARINALEAERDAATRTATRLAEALRQVRDLDESAGEADADSSLYRAGNIARSLLADPEVARLLPSPMRRRASEGNTDG